MILYTAEVVSVWMINGLLKRKWLRSDCSILSRSVLFIYLFICLFMSIYYSDIFQRCSWRIRRCRRTASCKYSNMLSHQSFRLYHAIVTGQIYSNMELFAVLSIFSTAYLLHLTNILKMSCLSNLNN